MVDTNYSSVGLLCMYEIIQKPSKPSTTETEETVQIDCTVQMDTMHFISKDIAGS